MNTYLYDKMDVLKDLLDTILAVFTILVVVQANVNHFSLYLTFIPIYQDFSANSNTISTHSHVKSRVNALLGYRLKSSSTENL